MKILNVQPVRILKYLSTKENFNLDEATLSSFYAPEFGFEVDKTDSLTTMLISFSIEYHVGYNNTHVFSYESCTSFNFESEGYDADLISLMEFIDKYYRHTESFLEQFGLLTQQQIEKSMQRNDRGYFKHIAEIAIDTLRKNNVYD